ncbi:uncharacterized protein [Palaemon carinicauda]|uniref:uncharacterized protein n=1 Tax=Palaemon carinicauda TaxID=392227 RepID=UPI0035B5A42D
MENHPSRSLRIKELGREDSSRLFERTTFVNPAEQITGECIPVEVGMVFCDLEMKRTGRHTSDTSIKYTDLLKYVREIQKKSKNPVVILLEGPAGVGKTTYLKLLRSQWMREAVSEESIIQELNKYDLLVNLECRNRSCRNLTDLLKLHWPRAFGELGDSEVLQSLSEFQLLFLCDGLDEADGATLQIFRQILGEMNDKMVAICATRAEKVGFVYRMRLALDKGMDVAHVQIKGVEGKHTQAFIQRYHETLREKGISDKETEGLLSYFKRNEKHLVDYWKIPLNLIYLIILWAYDPERVNQVTTVSELYFQINYLIKKRALERISRQNSQQSYQELEVKFKEFLKLLQKEALISLHEQANILKPKALKRLRKHCAQLGIDHEDAIGAFLIQKYSWTETSKDELEVSFTHKTQGEYLAACSLYDSVVYNSVPHDETIDDSLMQLFSSYNIPGIICHDMAKAALNVYHNWEKQQTSPYKLTIREAFYKILGKRVKFGNFQNVLVMMLGLLYQENCSDTKLLVEVIALLNISGVQQPYQWIQVLKSVKCNETVAKIIARKFDVIHRITAIKDDDVFAYASLLKDNKPHSISLKLREYPINTPRLDELLGICADQEIPLGYLGLNYLFRNPTDAFCSSCLIEPLKRAFLKCHVRQYHGQLTSSMDIPDSVGVLYVSISDNDGLVPITEIIQRKDWTIKRFGLCVNVSNFRGRLVGIPVKPPRTICLFLSDVMTEEDLRIACNIAESFMPENVLGKSCFTRLFFPRFDANIEDLIRELKTKNVKVKYDIFLPSSCKPTSIYKRKLLRRLAEKILGPEGTLEWGRGTNTKESIWDIDSW